MFMFGFTAGCFAIGWLSRYVPDRLLILVCAVGHFIAMFSFWYFYLSLVGAGVFLFVIGVFTGSIVVVFSFAKKIVPVSSYGVTSGFLNMFFGGFGILISPIVGYIYETTNNVYLSFVPTLVCSFIAMLLAIILKFMKVKPISGHE